ncbi:hypothetical protein [Desulfofustis glycolicus]|uniref:Uncharacterized protein n=1 Tax=Desulfofustis glycolicus DSM 9705 TaxID=1121409 RepID=A0A1M5XC80_9BACT|nr:hypothetical protein [Desulfofustis glycolicus]SHH97349.1 hypothetical protein SAMN02745124_02939 [Desulfofustis glycolicus DSM 9705]
MSNRKTNDYEEFDDMDEEDWELFMSGPDDDQIVDDEIQDEDEIMDPEAAEEMLNQYWAEETELYDCLQSHEQFYDLLCDELLMIIYQNNGDIEISDAYIKLKKSSFWDDKKEEFYKDNATVLGVKLTENNFIDTKEARRRNKFVLTRDAIKYCEKQLEEKTSIFDREEEIEEDDTPF